MFHACLLAADVAAAGADAAAAIAAAAAATAAAATATVATAATDGDRQVHGCFQSGVSYNKRHRSGVLRYWTLSLAYVLLKLFRHQKTLRTSNNL